MTTDEFGSDVSLWIRFGTWSNYHRFISNGGDLSQDVALAGIRERLARRQNGGGLTQADLDDLRKLEAAGRANGDIKLPSIAPRSAKSTAGRSSLSQERIIQLIDTGLTEPALDQVCNTAWRENDDGVRQEFAGNLDTFLWYERTVWRNHFGKAS